MYENILLAMAQYEQELDRQRGFCRICWGPLVECPGHKDYMEMFGPLPSEQEMAEYRADLEVRRRGLERKGQALEDAARALGYDGIDNLVAEVGPGWDDE